MIHRKAVVIEFGSESAAQSQEMIIHRKLETVVIQVGSEAAAAGPVLIDSEFGSESATQRVNHPSENSSHRIRVRVGGGQVYPNHGRHRKHWQKSSVSKSESRPSRQPSLSGIHRNPVDIKFAVCSPAH